MFTPQSESVSAENLAQRLESFKSHTPDTVKPTNPLMGTLSLEAEEEADSIVQEALEDDVAEETEEEVSPEFSAQFEQEFGLKPDQARELFDDLVNFKNELSLMRSWQVDPVEYDSRITQVREFYNTLPEEGREQFNSPEGAVAIWNHLSATAPKQPKKTRSARSVRPAAAVAAPVHEFTRSQVNKMSAADLQKNWNAINKAFMSGRILEDV